MSLWEKIKKKQSKSDSKDKSILQQMGLISSYDSLKKEDKSKLIDLIKNIDK